MPRYRFSEFILSPRRRMLIRNGREQPLIPRYFDLLVFLIERRGEAVHRRDIFDRIWSDVVVSDSALSQAIRTIRRVLGDDSREPRFVRTVSRHGYRFVFADVVEEDDEGEWQVADLAPPVHGAPPEAAAEPYEPLLQRVTRVAANASEEEEQREAAELLHALDTSEALRRLGTRPRHAFARALLRDTRWDAAEAGPVPILGQPAPLATARELVQSQVAPRGRSRRRTMGRRVDWRRPGGPPRRRCGRIDPHGRTRQRRLPGRRPRAGRHRRMLRRRRRGGRRRGAVGG